MRHYAAKTDAAQKDIVAGLLAAGVSWQALHMVGEGCPDGIAGWQGVTTLLEIKSSDYERRATRKNKTNEKQKAWAMRWRGGPVHVVVTLEEALRAVGRLEDPR